MITATFDAGTFLVDHFRTPTAVLAAAKQRNVRVPEYDTVRKWFNRAAIPSEWLPVLLMFREMETGDPVRISTYMQVEGREIDIFS
ncbi:MULTISPECIES: hypothetical protein [unclassified Shinella]|uniref:hypothetical protein n=1 Tax=unclassified Shinella TaxID=2643062 RepID=UPI00225C625A|nr:conserved hypothetical protein [Rhizobiaceae bacterium]CAK7259143.1 conserved protein of unknown function [Shinella sp. WSC3-e]